VLKYGPLNNFTKFRDALSEAVLKEFGPIGKLIKQEKLEMPEEPDRAEYKFLDSNGLDRAIYLEELKMYNHRLEEYEKNAPKLFGLILQYLSDESLEAVKKDEGWDDIKAEADPKGLWCEYTYILGALAKIYSGTQERSKWTRGDSTYTAGY
jgi:hypothetical protein